MSSKIKTVALTGKVADPRVVDTMRNLAEHLVRQKIGVLSGSEYDLDSMPDQVQFVAEASLASGADLIVAVGGDGSMLKAARAAAMADVPLLGINRGRLGFLADVSPDDSLGPLDEVLAGNYHSERRLLLTAEILSNEQVTSSGLALNDVVVKRQDTGRLLDFRNYVDETYVNTHAGDGFIVATPTGSTAYALSVGGPIVAPNLDAIVLAPICPHTLSDRPIVIPASSVTDVRVGDDLVETAEVSCDGEVIGKMGAGDRLRVQAAKQRVELIHPRGYDYFSILRDKLNWGRGNRRRSESG